MKFKKDDIKILIVEDEMIIAEDTNKSLALLGYNHNDIAMNDIEALQLTQVNDYSLILMDIRLLGSSRDGLELAEIIGNNCPIIFCTAFSDQETIKRILKTPHLSYILKPFEVAKISDIIHAVLKR